MQPDYRSRLIESLLKGRCGDPFAVLGPQRVANAEAWLVRVYLTWAGEVSCRVGNETLPMARVHADGLFEVVVPGVHRPDYDLLVTSVEGLAVELRDPYALDACLQPTDLAAFLAGEDPRAHRILGAHVMEHQGLSGTRFAVWAPRAHNVNLMGTFNRWQGRSQPMRRVGATGVWELFVPHADPGALYKFEVHGVRPGVKGEKADPFGRGMELRPQTASVVVAVSQHEWRDEAWMAATIDADRSPISVYEVHLGSWRRTVDSPSDEDQGWLSYRQLAEELVPYVVDLGFTHIELLPITEFPYDGSWGYQTLGYFAPTSRFGSGDDLRAFVDTAHRAGLGVILDWVPGHFPRDGHGLVFFDGDHLFEHSDPNQAQHPDWGTFVFDYSRPEIVSFLVSSAVYWIEEFHLDGLRVDAVASMLHLDYSRDEGKWTPNKYGGRENLEAIEFLKRFNHEVHQARADVLTFAEESAAWPGVTAAIDEGGLGFDLKWNMGWMNDILSYMQLDPLFRSGSHDELTFSIHYAFQERHLLPFSHDEVVHGKASLLSKMAGDREQQFAAVRLLYGFMFAHPGKKLLFMGAELGQWSEWNFAGQLDWWLLEHAPHQQLHAWIRRLNGFYRQTPALHGADFAWQGFEWLDLHDADRSILAFMRWADEEKSRGLLVVANFTPVARPDYQVGVPQSGSYRVVLSSQEHEGAGPYETQPVVQGEWSHSLVVPLPPLAIVFLEREA